MRSKRKTGTGSKRKTSKFSSRIAYLAYRFGALPYALRATDDPFHWVKWDYSGPMFEAGAEEGLEAIATLRELVNDETFLSDAEQAIITQRERIRAHRHGHGANAKVTKQIKSQKEQMAADGRFEAVISGSLKSLPPTYRIFAELLTFRTSVERFSGPIRGGRGG